MRHFASVAVAHPVRLLYIVWLCIALALMIECKGAVDRQVLLMLAHAMAQAEQVLVQVSRQAHVPAAGHA